MTEAEQMFACFVRRGPASPDLLRSYEAALRTLEISADPVTDRLIAARADLVSAEYALRLRHPQNGLTRRALVSIALAEARPEYGTLFLPRPKSRLRACSELAMAPLAAAVSFCKGTWYLWWHARRV